MYHTYIGKEVSIVTREREKEKGYQEVFVKIVLLNFHVSHVLFSFLYYFTITNRIINNKFLTLNLMIENY